MRENQQCQNAETGSPNFIFVDGDGLPFRQADVWPRCRVGHLQNSVAGFRDCLKPLVHFLVDKLLVRFAHRALQMIVHGQRLAIG